MQDSSPQGEDGGRAAEGTPELAVLGPDPLDPSCLSVSAPDGTRYRLRGDAALRVALRQLGPPAGVAGAVAQPLRPREIQTRIRAGESAEDVAASAGVPVEQVRRYEGPVLAERSHVAALARSAPVRTAGARPALEELVRERLATRGVEAASVTWDAWRRDEHRWSVTAAFRAGGRDRHAQWAFDPPTLTLEALDDEARWLSAVQDATPRTGRRLSAVRVYDVEDDGWLREVPPAEGDDGSAGVADALEGVDVIDVADPEDVAARTLDLLDALRDRRGRRQPVLDSDEESWGEDDEDELVSALLDLPPGAHAPSSEEEDDLDLEVLLTVEPRLRVVTREPTGRSDAVASPDEAARPVPGAQDGVAPEDVHEPRGGALEVGEQRPSPGAVERGRDLGGAGGPDGPGAGGDDDGDGGDGDEGARPAVRPRRRPSVPSWDEIVFGSPRTD